MLVPKPKNMTKAPTPNRACTIEGTPARLMMARLMARVNQLSGAYSLRYNAAATPTGTEISNATPTSHTVPSNAGKIPPSVMPLVGLENRNSREMMPLPLTTRVVRIINTGSINSPAIIMKRIRNRFSLRLALTLSPVSRNWLSTLAVCAMSFPSPCGCRGRSDLRSD